MSLVNDLLIESERRRSAPGRRRRAPTALDDLVPVRPARRESPTLRRVLLALGATGLFAALAALAALTTIDARERPLDPPQDPARATPPAVAARRVEPRSTSKRPVQIASIGLERSPTSTQIRVVCDARTTSRLERDDAQGRLELVLTGATLVDATEPLDLLETPIRSLDVRSEAPDLHLVFALDPGVRAQTRWLDVAGGAELVLDLQAPSPIAPSSKSEAPSAEASLARTSIADTSNADEALTVAPTSNRPAAIAPAAESGFDAAPAPADDDEWADAEAEPSDFAVDRVVSPSLGDPAELRIERSERDRVRQERAAIRATIADAVAAARRARAEGRLEDAENGYAEVAKLAPEDWTVVCEWAALLVARARPEDALALVKRARLRAPRHQGLLMTEARLLEAKGDRKAALALLDGSGLALTEAPDVHALAAAYHQKAGDHATAIERYEQLLRRFPEESRSWLGLGISLEAVGRREEARDVYRIALQVGELPRESRRWVGTRIAALGGKD